MKYTCEVCGKTKTETTGKADHTWNDFYTVYVQATYSEDGSESIHCSVCNTIKDGSSRAIPKLVKTDDQKQSGEETLAKASVINKAAISASDIRKAADLGATTVTLGAKTKKIQKNAFKGTKITAVTIKSKKLKAKSVKDSLKGSKVRTIKIKVGNKKTNKTYVKKYKKIFTKKKAGRKVVVK